MGTGTTLYRFGEFTLDPRHHALLRHGQLIPITPKCLETLTFLVKHPGQLVQKDQLMDALWPECFVEEANLKQNIYVLRRLLGDDSKGDSFIATVPRRGYKFIGPVTQTEVAENTQENGNGAGPSSATIQYWVQHSPFRGLQVFEPEDAWLFFGRESETEALVERLGRSRVLVVAGNSGCGKSSLVRAGLIPALRYGCNSESWRTVLFRPSANPVDYLAEVLPGQLQPGWSPQQQAEFAAGCRSKFANDPSALPNAVMSLLSTDRHRPSFNGNGAAGDDNPGTPHVLLIADQFEEIFTLVGDQRLRSQYIDMLLEASQWESSVSISLVLVLRADFYARCLDHPGLSRCLETNLFNVPRLMGDKLRENIEKRLELAGACAEAGLIDRLLEDVGSEPGNLALLEHALDQLWATCGGFGHTLTNRAYAAIGGLRGALGKHADQVYEELAEPQLKTLAQRIFLELVYLGENADVADIKDTRRRVSKSELLSLGPPDLVEPLIARLATARLIATGREGEETFVEVSHEALIREWPRLREWLAENRDQLRFERRLHRAAEEWEALQRDPGALLQGVRLAQAEEWRARAADAPALTKTFVETSLAARAEAQEQESARQRAEAVLARRAARRLRWFAGALAVMLVAAAVIAWRAYRQQTIEKAHALAAKSGEMLGEDRGIALDLALKSLRLARTDETYRAVTRAFPQTLAVLNHDGPVSTAVFSPDGQYVLTSSADRLARLWGANDGRLVTTLRHRDAIHEATFSLDGARIVTASNDHTAKVWNTADGRLLAVLKGHTDQVWQALFSRDGRRIVTSSVDGTVRIWNSSNGQLLTTLRSATAFGVHVAFSPDGRWVATASQNSAQVWDSVTGRLFKTFLGHTFHVYDVEFSPDGQQIVTAADDRTARIWNIADGHQIAVLRHEGTVDLASFSPDGERIVTISYDRTARIWNSHTGALLFTLAHDGPVQHAEFSPDGRFVVTASFDHYARLWSSSDGRLLVTFSGHTGAVYHASFSPSGDRIVTAGEDHTARLWYTVSGAVRTSLQGHTGLLSAAAFTPDNKRIVTASTDGMVRVWDASSGRQLITLKHDGPVLNAALSSDGKQIASASADRTARVWSVIDGHLMLTLTGHSDNVWSAEFSPDGQRIVTASSDHTARLWNAANGQVIAVLHHADQVRIACFSMDGLLIVTAGLGSAPQVWSGIDGHPLFALMAHSGRVWSANFSPDNRLIVTAGEDGTARVWSSRDGRLSFTLRGHKGPLRFALFSSDGRRIVTGGSDQTARVWSGSDGRLLNILQGHNADVFGVTFSPDGRQILTADLAQTARLWNVSDGRALLKFEGSWIAKFSPNGQRILILSSAQNGVRIWQILTLDDLARILAEH